MSGVVKYGSAEVVDFSEGRNTSIVQYAAHVCFGEFSVCRCTFAPNTGMNFTSPQLLIGVHAGKPVKLIWHEGELERTKHANVGQVMIVGPQSQQYMAWPDHSLRLNVIAIDKAMVKRILTGVGANPDTRIEPSFALKDSVLRQLVQACQDEIAESGDLGRLFMDGLAVAILTRVYRCYADVPFPKITKGGLTPRDTQRVLSYIEEHLHRDIGLGELAASVSLSAHYFIEAFKKTIGMPPYRYLLHRRVQRAKDLLLREDLSPAKIAEEVGFSSQSQLTINFRKIVGTTPARYRREAH
jgi:AraC family transcriptional regulator